MVFGEEEGRERHRQAVRRYRARQTPTERDEVRRRERDRKRRVTQEGKLVARPAEANANSIVRSKSGHDSHLEQQGWSDGKIPRLHPVTATTKECVLKRLRVALGASGLDEVTCSICDCHKRRKECQVVAISDTDRMQQMHELLSSADETLPAGLVAEYDCSNGGNVPALSGMLLSKRGVHLDGKLDICDECNASLMKLSIPKFAIKNGFAVGTLPDSFAEMTLPERLMTQTVSVTAVTRVMRGGAHRSIRSHCLVFDCMPGPPVTLLPTPMDSVSSFRVVLAGPFTTEQQARLRQMHRVRRKVVEDVLVFYRRHNQFYANVGVDCTGVPVEAVPDHLISVEPNASVDMDADNERVGELSEHDTSNVETDVIERRMVFVSDDREVSIQQAPLMTGQATQGASEPQFLVRHSTQFAQKDKALFARMFPHLFPYGRGHPGEKRHVPVSLEACIRHYSQLSSRRFAEDELFMMASFDYMSVQKMFTHVALKCQRNPGSFEPYSDVTEETLIKALNDKELQRQGRVSATTQGHGSRAKDFLNTVEMSSGALWGSDAERAHCRRSAFAYQARYGQPALFVTLTPNVAESFVMATYTGITSIDTLFDANVAEPPGKSALHSASMRNDAASARLFMRNMDAFIDHVLGVPPKHMKGKPFDGLFGEVKAYFGMVETQGGGTLHAHFLVWLVNAPPNSVAFDEAVAEHGDMYFRDIEKFTDSIVSTSMPLRVEDVSCHFCGHSYADLKELPIPPAAYEDPNKHQDVSHGEPLLVQCSGCGKAMSSQHVLRRVLLENRPSSWPPTMREPTRDEIETAISLETSCRGSATAAKIAFSRRDMMLSTAEPDVDISGDILRTLNGEPRRFERRQDDAFRDDVVTRVLVMQPPSIDDQRWAPRVVAFAISLLVFVLNLHWWSHVGSCFKKSRGSTRGQCRYGFPRTRVEQTLFLKNDGVQLARRAPFEFVNGFNSVMMLAFKSNHDIQVMIGGVEALVRIYYATKYVTKMQEQIDSITAVALSAFKRRQLREQRDSGLAMSRSDVGRKRVASLLFAITNRREIAGPLAALYILRGSCAYMSTSCAILPLRNVVDELIQHAAHSCSLIELQEDGSDIGFRAASFLDDYRFRPLTLGQICLYEFVMKHFRGKRHQTTSTAALFLPEHPLFSTHCVGTHTNEVVPVVTGMRLPYLDSKSPQDLIVKRSQCALVLFKPFRAVTDLVLDPKSSDDWIRAYTLWEPTRKSFTREIMANMDDYYLATRTAKEYRAVSAAEGADVEPDLDEDSGSLTGTHGDINAALNGIDTDEVIHTSVAKTDSFFHNFNCDGNATTDSDDTDEVARDDESSRLPIFPNCSDGLGFVNLGLLSHAAANTVSSIADVLHRCRTLDFSATELHSFVNDTSNDEIEPLNLRETDKKQPTEVVELIMNALDADSEWSPHEKPPGNPPLLQPYVSIDQVSKAFTLNQRQHAAFVTITTSFLRRILHQEHGSLNDNGGNYCTGSFEAQLQVDQLLMFLGGAGGTGKSRVIDAVGAFCSSWHHDDSIVKTALTGKAATLIGGRTLASFLLRLRRAIKEKKFTPLDLLVIDEVSMMSKAEWLKVDKLLRRYKQVLGVPFGGVHIVLVGDFLQMPPVNADPVYIDPVDKAKPSTSDIEGFDLWRKFTTVVMLEESVRFHNDPAWGDGCRSARLGKWTPEFVDLINSRVLQQPGSQGLLQNQIGDSAVFVTPENVTRLAINNALPRQQACCHKTCCQSVSSRTLRELSMD